MAGDEQLMADPYASGGAPAPASALPSAPGLPGGWAAKDDLYLNASEPAATPDFLFEDSYEEGFRRSWGERLTYHVGVAYLGGFTVGGFTGLYQGLRSSAGERQRIRI